MRMTMRYVQRSAELCQFRSYRPFQLIHPGGEHFNLLCVSCRPKFERGITSLHCVGKKFFELCFLQFSVAQVIVGLRNQLINNFVFPTWAFNNNNNIIENSINSLTLSIPLPCHTKPL